MATIKVHLLNFHGPYSHIEIVLENTSSKDKEFYRINRWETDPPNHSWDSDYELNSCKKYIQEASCVFSFNMEANPDDITREWKNYWNKTQQTASIFGNNCAVATQWFLKKFANIPGPDFLNVSFNHLAFGIVWPSLMPCFVTLPGRIMSNAKFHIEAKENPQLLAKYSYLILNINMALTLLTWGFSVIALSIAASVLTGGIASVALVACVTLGAVSAYGFFKAYNLSSKKIISDCLSDKHLVYTPGQFLSN